MDLQLQPGAMLFHRGDSADDLFRVESGHLSVTTSGPGGQHLLLGFLRPADLFGEVGLFSIGGRSAAVTAIEPTRLSVIPGGEVRSLLETDGDFALQLLEASAERLRWLTERVEDEMFLDVPARLAKRLAQLARDFGEEVDDGVRIRLRVSQGDLGAMISASRESVNKHLRILSGAGILRTESGRMVVLEPDRLDEMAGGA